MPQDHQEMRPRKLEVKDANVSDDKIPRGLILMYGDTPYIQKAGLEWKANKLFGGAGYSIGIEFVERDREQKYYLVKATLKVLSNGAIFENYGEASTENVNSLMQKNLLHLAVTRAECRVLRMATACGYASYDEVMTLPSFTQAKIEIVGGDKPASEEQKATIKSLDPKAEMPKDMTKQQASDLIAELSKK